MDSNVVTVEPELDTDLRAEAVKSLKRKRDFRAHLFAYTLINLVVWATWAVIVATTDMWFPWPIFVTFGWGIGLVFHAWDTYGRKPMTEGEIQREEERLRRR